MRYLMLMDWATIARVLYGDKPGFYDGKMYRQRALMLHKDTMVWLEKGLLTEEKLSLIHIFAELFAIS